MNSKAYVNYEKFGALGDGVTNDFAAIKAAHDFANENGLPVRTDPSKTYYISDTRIDGCVESIRIRTNTDWSDTHFIIDDTNYCSSDGTGISSKHVFTVESDYPEEVICDEEILSRLYGIGEGTKKLDLALGYPALLFVYDENKHVYGRSGASFKNGAQALGPTMHEAILVDGDGNVDESTPFIFNYETVTKIEVIRCDITPITVEGGIFTTRASHGPGRYTDADGNLKKNGYVARGLRVNRSFTTLKNIKHYVEGEITTKEQAEGKLGAHYHGFFAAYRANEVVIDSCVLTGRRYYKVSGTYDFTANEVNIIRLINCTQSNFRMKDEEGREVYSMSISPLTGTRYCWGIGGTNFCKNMEYINCRLSRFDAHRGLMNGKIINSEINFIALTGKGKFEIENVDWYAVGETITNNAFIYLRGDYGSTWEDEISIKNVRATPVDKDFYFMYHSYSNFVYGHKCCVPDLVIDNFELVGRGKGEKIKIMDENRSVLKEPNLHLDTVVNIPKMEDDGTADYKNYNPIRPPRYIKVKNDPYGYSYIISDSDFYRETKTEGVTVVSKEDYNN